MKNKEIILCQIVAILLLAISFMDMEYYYYQLLRWYVCILGTYLTYIYYQSKGNFWRIAFGMTAVIFNPITPIYFDREVWEVLNVLLVVLLIINIFNNKRV